MVRMADTYQLWLDQVRDALRSINMQRTTGSPFGRSTSEASTTRVLKLMTPRRRATSVLVEEQNKSLKQDCRQTTRLLATAWTSWCVPTSLRSYIKVQTEGDWMPNRKCSTSRRQVTGVSRFSRFTDRSYAREGVQQHGESARKFLWGSLGINENHDAADVPSSDDPASEDFCGMNFWMRLVRMGTPVFLRGERAKRKHLRKRLCFTRLAERRDLCEEPTCHSELGAAMAYERGDYIKVEFPGEAGMPAVSGCGSRPSPG